MKLIETTRIKSKAAIGAALLTFILISTGCETGGKTGALAGAGIGALAGQAIGGNTAGTLIGAAVGTGIGYMIGNEQDKKHAREMSQNQPPNAPTNSEVGTLGGTRWKLVSLSPQSITTPYTSKIVEFRPNGRVITTTTRSNGTVAVYDESYRVLGDTLIINKPGYLINARFSQSAGQLIITTEEFRAVLQRL